ncbi:MAG: TIGR03560 family F420-dependent LLM class oxidoreductase [Deltaproteobacteria bacterium]|nr:TIGR03560 family F420-dependent LLM class oxidoreductase [Deltaproteobacteria bacterium]MBI3386420.1 TIGR03560 family F420-dependent LLM class oxidoreductase [Deltaproteobacteria bacterium]
MSTLFGVHTGPQNCTLDDLRQVWHLADRSGFHWVSIWDHFYPAMLVPGDAQGTCFEAVSIMTALAAETKHVRVGSLVYCISYRHPAVLANAMVTIDHVSGGRMELGLGAGWSQLEYDAYGIPFLPIKDRLDQLEEGLQVVRGLFTQEVTNFNGKHFTLTNARCEPKPVQRSPRLWVGGMGEKRLLRMVAKYADGWNVPFIGPELFAQKNQVLTRWCEKEQRDPSAILRTINLGLAIGRNEAEAQTKRDGLKAQFGGALSFMEPGMLIGTPQQVIDRIGQYVRNGAEWIILALRAPFDVEGLHVFIDEVMPVFRA